MEFMKYLVVLTIVCLMMSAFIAGCTNVKSTNSASVPNVPVSSMSPGVNSATGTDSDLTGNWNFQSGMYGGGNAFIVPTNVQITAVFDNQGNLNGFAGCNDYNAKYTLTGQQLTMGKEIEIGPVSSTQKSCADTSSIETAYLNVLQNTNAYVVHGNSLVLTDKQNDHLVFQR